MFKIDYSDRIVYFDNFDYFENNNLFIKNFNTKNMNDKPNTLDPLSDNKPDKASEFMNEVLDKRLINSPDYWRDLFLEYKFKFEYAQEIIDKLINKQYGK